jgi:hypothetical protein
LKKGCHLAAFFVISNFFLEKKVTKNQGRTIPPLSPSFFEDLRLRELKLSPDLLKKEGSPLHGIAPGQG